MVLLHGGGPDHRSLLPLAGRLADTYRIVLPGIRGYGQSPCPDPAAHTWSRYAEDVTALLHHLGAERASIGGMCLGSTITARAATAYPERFAAAISISLEAIEDDAAAFAESVTARGVEAAWAPILPGLVSGDRDAGPRGYPPRQSGRHRRRGRHRPRPRVRTPAELAALTAPTPVIPGVDHRHPTRFAEKVTGLLPDGRLERGVFPDRIDTADDLAAALAPSIRQFRADTVGRREQPPVPPGYNETATGPRIRSHNFGGNVTYKRCRQLSTPPDVEVNSSGRWPDGSRFQQYRVGDNGTHCRRACLVGEATHGL